ncbi:hypothetical protein M2266_001234 [Streptomyces sp. SPB162]|nr:hypothetical protein [Streptomyces sp. SPB162]
MCAGFLPAATGFRAVTLVGADSPLWWLLVASSGYASGLVLVMALVTEMVIGVAPPERAGAASAFPESATELGGALGMVVVCVAAAVLALYALRNVAAVPPTGPADRTDPTAPVGERRQPRGYTEDSTDGSAYQSAVTRLPCRAATCAALADASASVGCVPSMAGATLFTSVITTM